MEASARKGAVQMEFCQIAFQHEQMDAFSSFLTIFRPFLRTKIRIRPNNCILLLPFNTRRLYFQRIVQAYLIIQPYFYSRAPGSIFKGYVDFNCVALLVDFTTS